MTEIPDEVPPYHFTVDRDGSLTQNHPVGGKWLDGVQRHPMAEAYQAATHALAFARQRGLTQADSLSRAVIDAVWPLAVEAAKQQYLAERRAQLQRREARIPDDISDADAHDRLDAHLAALAARRQRERDAIGAEYLEESRDATRRLSVALIALRHLLDTPYSDAPEWTPWSRFITSPLRRLRVAVGLEQDALLAPSGTPSGNDTEDPEVEPRYRCPVHGKPDCAPYYNGCDLLTEIGVVDANGAPIIDEDTP